jgi:hypothetical protein
MKRGLNRSTWAALAVALLAALAAVSASAAVQAAPQTTSPPTVEGKFQVGETVSAGTGSWANNPTTYAYQWQRCTSAGASCVDIAGADQKSYKLTTDEVGRRVRVLVTASNADGKSTANSHPSPIVSDSSAPRNTTRPTISGTAEVGQALTVSNGSWTGGVTSYTFQWLRCDENGNACVNVSGATSRSYGVRSDDAGSTLRAEVTAHNAAGRTTVNTDRSAVVGGAPGSTTVVTTTTTTTNHAPGLTFISLNVRANRVYVRFRVCDDSYGRVTIIARDSMARRLSYTRRLAVSPAPCGTYARNWSLIPRFRAHGRFAVSLRAVDKSGKLSLLRSRSVLH